MKEVQTAFSNMVQDINFNPLNTPVISNVTAQPYHNTQIAKLLIQQITHPVQWKKNIRYAITQDEKEFKEILFGNRLILTSMIKKLKKLTKQHAQSSHPSFIKVKPYKGYTHKIS